MIRDYSRLKYRAAGLSPGLPRPRSRGSGDDGRRGPTARSEKIYSPRGEADLPVFRSDFRKIIAREGEEKRLSWLILSSRRVEGAGRLRSVLGVLVLVVGGY